MILIIAQFIIIFSRESSFLHSLFLIIKLGYLKRIIYFYGDQSIYKYYKVLLKKNKVTFYYSCKTCLKIVNVPRLYTRESGQLIIIHFAILILNLFHLMIPTK